MTKGIAAKLVLAYEMLVNMLD